MYVYTVVHLPDLNNLITLGVGTRETTHLAGQENRAEKLCIIRNFDHGLRVMIAQCRAAGGGVALDVTRLHRS